MTQTPFISGAARGNRTPALITPSGAESECTLCPKWVIRCGHLPDGRVLVVTDITLTTFAKHVFTGMPRFGLGLIKPPSGGITQPIAVTDDHEEADRLFTLAEADLLGAAS